MNIVKLLNQLLYLTVLMLFAVSCQKVDVPFGESISAENDPNLIYLDNQKVNVSTFKPDSFITSSTETISIGFHTDPIFGVLKAGSYVELNMPASNPVANQTVPVVFDSLELIVKAAGVFYGDSSLLIKINVHRLTQNIKGSDTYGDVYYNTSAFAYDPVPIGQKTVNLYGKSGSLVRIRLSDALGQELLTKFKNNDDDIATAERFVNYLKGLYITTDTIITNSINYFPAKADSMLIRLSYHDNGLFPVQKYIDLTYKEAKQFNNFAFRYTHPDFSSFINNKTQLIPSASSGNRSYMNTNMGTYPRFSFPEILNLKELHPYIKIIKAVLVIKPDSMSSMLPYNLPPTLNVYSTDGNNYPITPMFTDPVTQQFQTGDLFVDHLYGENTNYSYDISGFINTLISEGQFSTSALLLYPTVSDFGGAIQRLIVNDQTRKRSVQLKLYVLGL